jgi:hypothetical protein
MHTKEKGLRLAPKSLIFWWASRESNTAPTDYETHAPSTMRDNKIVLQASYFPMNQLYNQQLFYQLQFTHRLHQALLSESAVQQDDAPQYQRYSSALSQERQLERDILQKPAECFHYAYENIFPH